MISIINYGLGNIGSIQNMLSYLGYESSIANSPEDLEYSSKIILPGVGSFDTGMNNLIKNDWLPYLNEKVLTDKIPVLGICLGLQLMCKGSEEGKLAGLGYFNAEVKKFQFSNFDIKIPHIGWNTIKAVKESPLLLDELEDRRYYFVHSYFVEAYSDDEILMKTEYGFQYTSAMEKGNIIGVQFHPEKSHKFGLSLLKNFASNY